MTSSRCIFTLPALAAALLASGGNALARDVHWSVGIGLPGVVIGAGTGYAYPMVRPGPPLYLPAPPVYATPLPPVYAAPLPPVYAAPPPVYYTPAPRPIYYTPPPAYYTAPPIWYDGYGYRQRGHGRPHPAAPPFPHPFAR